MYSPASVWMSLMHRETRPNILMAYTIAFVIFEGDLRFSAIDPWFERGSEDTEHRALVWPRLSPRRAGLERRLNRCIEWHVLQKARRTLRTSIGVRCCRCSRDRRQDRQFVNVLPYAPSQFANGAAYLQSPPLAKMNRFRSKNWFTTRSRT